VNNLLRWLFTPYQASPIRWTLVGGLVAIIVVLLLLGWLP